MPRVTSLYVAGQALWQSLLHLCLRMTELLYTEAVQRDREGNGEGSDIKQETGKQSHVHGHVGSKGERESMLRSQVAHTAH